MFNRWTESRPPDLDLYLSLVLLWGFGLLVVAVVATVVLWLWAARWRVRRPRILRRAGARYRGRLEPTGAIVEVLDHGEVRLLPGQRPGTDDEFGWGYAGPGAERLAACMLRDYAPLRASPQLARRFAREVVARLPLGDFELDERQLRVWLAPHVAFRRQRRPAAPHGAP